LYPLYTCVFDILSLNSLFHWLQITQSIYPNFNRLCTILRYTSAAFELLHCFLPLPCFFFHSHADCPTEMRRLRMVLLQMDLVWYTSHVNGKAITIDKRIRLYSYSLQSDIVSYKPVFTPPAISSPIEKGYYIAHILF